MASSSSKKPPAKCIPIEGEIIYQTNTKAEALTFIRNKKYFAGGKGTIDKFRRRFTCKAHVDCQNIVLLREVNPVVSFQYEVIQPASPHHFDHSPHENNVVQIVQDRKRLIDALYGEGYKAVKIIDEVNKQESEKGSTIQPHHSYKIKNQVKNRIAAMNRANLMKKLEQTTTVSSHDLKTKLLPFARTREQFDAMLWLSLEGTMALR